MAVSFEHSPSPRIENRRHAGPPTIAGVVSGFNGRVALGLTRVVGTMWCAYVFALLALVALPAALESGSVLAIVQWISQTFIQLVMLSVIMVGQNIIGQAADRRSEMTYKDADATFHEAGQIQQHLAAQDDALNQLLTKVATLEGQLRAATPGRAAEG
jgi:hypothetical protein